MAWLQTAHAIMKAKPAPAPFGGVVASLLEILLPAQRTSIGSVCLESDQLCWHLGMWLVWRTFDLFLLSVCVIGVLCRSFHRLSAMNSFRLSGWCQLLVSYQMHVDPRIMHHQPFESLIKGRVLS